MQHQAPVSTQVYDAGQPRANNIAAYDVLETVVKSQGKEGKGGKETQLLFDEVGHGSLTSAKLSGCPEQPVWRQVGRCFMCSTAPPADCRYLKTGGQPFPADNGPEPSRGKTRSCMSSKDAIIVELRELVARLSKQVQEQARRIVELELQLAKALKNSSISSKSPSSDIVKPPKKKKVDRHCNMPQTKSQLL